MQMPFVQRSMQDAILSARYVVKLLVLAPWDFPSPDATKIDDLKYETRFMANQLTLNLAKTLVASPA